MTLPIAIIDTNVIVSGLVTSNKDAATTRVIRAMRSSRFLFLLSEDLLSEYMVVLSLPEVVAKHGFEPDELTWFIGSLIVRCLMRALPPADWSSDHHIESLVAAMPGAILVTSDKPLAQRMKKDGHAVMTPAGFVTLL